MIPHQSALRDDSGNGVSCRVEACRRRLRAIRTQKVQVETDHDTQATLSSEAAFTEARSEELEEAGLT
jgi:hypothetical protein